MADADCPGVRRHLGLCPNVAGIGRWSEDGIAIRSQIWVQAGLRGVRCSLSRFNDHMGVRDPQ